MIEEAKVSQGTQDALNFTGNWFLDAGIIGFVNLMEEVYGWDLGKLQEMIDKESEKVYFGYFPFAYFYGRLGNGEPNEEQEKKRKILEKIRGELAERSFQDSKELFNFVWYDFICDLLKDQWIESICKNLFTKDLEERTSKIIYIKDAKIRQSVDGMKEIQLWLDSERSEEIKNILNKKKKAKLSYDDMKNLMASVSSDASISEDLRDAIDKFKKEQEKLYIFLKNDWENNVVNKKKTDEAKDDFYRLPVDDGFYKNFLFFNTSSGFEKQKDSFYSAISFDAEKEKVLDKIDKTINKLLPSESEFPNINYARFSTESFREQFERLFVYLLCFKRAFEWYGDKYTFFYSNDLEFTYRINKKLRLYKKRHNSAKMSGNILAVTWRQIIDSLVEYKSAWSLENMYMISYKKLDNQVQEGIEYIGIPKLQASIIIDDSVREKLNTRIQYLRGKSYWLIEEFVKGKSLYPLILGHTSLALNDKKVPYRKRSSLYSLIIDAKILEVQANKERKIFSQDYFDNYRFLVDEIKDEIRHTYFSVSLINEILNRILNQVSRNTDEIKEIKNRIARELLNAIKANDKNAFLNILLKNLNDSKGVGSSEFNKSIDDWIFDRVISNDISFERYELALVTNLMSGGEKK